MSNALSQSAADLAVRPDGELVELARQRHSEAFRVIMQRHNRRLYRVARSVLHDEHEAEDVVQEAYVRAFAGLGQFRGESSLATWLTRIALNEALGRKRARRPTVELADLETPRERDAMQIIPFPLNAPGANPEEAAAQQDIRRVLERAIGDLPERFRIVFILRDVEGLNVEETAAQLSLRPQTVRTRLHRARAQLRETVSAQLQSVLSDAFPFAGARCERITEAVLRRLGIPT